MFGTQIETHVQPHEAHTYRSLCQNNRAEGTLRGAHQGGPGGALPPPPGVGQCLRVGNCRGCRPLLDWNYEGASDVMRRAGARVPSLRWVVLAL